MNRMQLLLMKLSEEAVEVSQMAMKCAQFGLDECKVGETLHNKGRFHAELNDLLAAIRMLDQEFDFDFQPDDDAIQAKIEKVNRYAEYSAKLGLLSGGLFCDNCEGPLPDEPCRQGGYCCCTPLCLERKLFKSKQAAQANFR